MKSLVLIVPAAEKPAADAVAVGLGYADPGAQSYNVALSASGQQPATHYGCHTWGTDGFAIMLEIVKTGVVPDGIPEQLSTPALGVRVQSPGLAAGLIVSVMPEGSDAYAHFESKITENSLQRVEVAL